MQLKQTAGLVTFSENKFIQVVKLHVVKILLKVTTVLSKSYSLLPHSGSD